MNKQNHVTIESDGRKQRLSGDCVFTVVIKGDDVEMFADGFDSTSELCQILNTVKERVEFQGVLSDMGVSSTTSIGEC